MSDFDFEDDINTGADGDQYMGGSAHDYPAQGQGNENGEDGAPSFMDQDERQQGGPGGDSMNEHSYNFQHTNGNHQHQDHLTQTQNAAQVPSHTAGSQVGKPQHGIPGPAPPAGPPPLHVMQQQGQQQNQPHQQSQTQLQQQHAQAQAVPQHQPTGQQAAIPGPAPPPYPPPAMAQQPAQTTHAGTQEALASGNKIYLANLQWWITDLEVETLCKEYGEVLACDFMTERSNGKSKGIVTIEFATAEQAASARESLNGRVLQGRPIIATFLIAGPGAKPGPPHSVYTQEGNIQRQANYGAGRGGFGGRGQNWQKQSRQQGSAGNRFGGGGMGHVGGGMMGTMDGSQALPPITMGAQAGMMPGVMPGMMAPGMMGMPGMMPGMMAPGPGMMGMPSMMGQGNVTGMQ